MSERTPEPGPEGDGKEFKVLDFGRILRYMLIALGGMLLVALILLAIAYGLGRFG
ncbi:hypothetical protein [Enemella dayhoffiae]|uniref:hypothetical protein n=1 Tax=Enemella dayhoffiae TaxID=2016507 RepID=UPI00159554B2|nr:hypothetical protein [Enemella dayhoffiae]